jgi:hypothetical protein
MVMSRARLERYQSGLLGYFGVDPGLILFVHAK